jgi:hypothetical protein
MVSAHDDVAPSPDIHVYVGKTLSEATSIQNFSPKASTPKISETDGLALLKLVLRIMPNFEVNKVREILEENQGAAEILKGAIPASEGRSSKEDDMDYDTFCSTVSYLSREFLKIDFNTPIDGDKFTGLLESLKNVNNSPFASNEDGKKDFEDLIATLSKSQNKDLKNLYESYQAWKKGG